MAPTAAETACFEAGVKFGALYHQFAGTPVSPASAASLETAMAEAIENQPFCEQVTVCIDPDRVRQAAADGPGGNTYAELTGTLMDVDILISRDDVRIHTQMRMRDGYPKMELVEIDRP